MKNKIKKTICSFVVMSLLIGGLAGCGKGNAIEVDNGPAALEEEISSENIMSTVKELISEKYLGRLAGTRENQLAAEYIAGCYKKIGLESPKGLDNYMQFYKQPVVELTEEPKLQILDSSGKPIVDFKYVKEFVLRRLSGEADKVDMDASLYVVEDPGVLYQNSSKLKGKILLIPYKYNYLLGYHNTPVDFAETCGAAGAIGQFDLNYNNLGFTELKVSTLIGSWLQTGSYKPFVYVDTDSFEKLTAAAKTGNKLHLSFNSRKNIDGSAANVIGLIPGSDPKLKDKYIIIGAHFDHVGSNANGTYNPGALDNASGPSAMLELARVLKESKLQPRQSILFIAFNGESGGLRGSTYYCNHPIGQLGDSVMINLDMVGSAAKIPLTIALSNDISDERIRNDLLSYAEELSIACEKGIEAGSDHTSFSNRGVPAALLINLDYKSGYHTPHDTIDSVDGERVKEIVKLVRYYISKKAY